MPTRPPNLQACVRFLTSSQRKTDIESPHIKPVPNNSTEPYNPQENVGLETLFCSEGVRMDALGGVRGMGFRVGGLGFRMEWG